MKKIILLGDSIRLGYENYVKENLDGVCEVYSPKENCRMAEYVLRTIIDWKREENFPEDADLIFWNAGLWDVARIMHEEPITPPEFYRYLIKHIDKRLRLLFPKAKIAFATSTAVIEEEFDDGFTRHNYDIEYYNQIAKEVLSETDTLICDLYEATKNAPEVCHSDVTHYNSPEGVELVGGTVLSFIAKTLGIELSGLKQAKEAVISEEILGR